MGSWKCSYELTCPNRPQEIPRKGPSDPDSSPRSAGNSCTVYIPGSLTLVAQQTHLGACSIAASSTNPAKGCPHHAHVRTAHPSACNAHTPATWPPTDSLHA
eukprot:6378811-Amphidinium_carterae.1